MSRLARKLQSDRASRDAAREVFDERLAQLRADLDAKSIGGRIVERIGEDARIVLDEAIDVAENNRGVVIGTIAALMVWFFRKPILAWLDRLTNGYFQEEATDEHH